MNRATARSVPTSRPLEGPDRTRECNSRRARGHQRQSWAVPFCLVGKPDPLISRMLDEARDDIKHADQKAAVLLAALGVGFGAVLGGQLSAGWDSSALTPCGQFVWWVGVLAAVASVVLAALAVWPRYKITDRPEYGVTYWGHVSAFNDLDELVQALDHQGIKEDLRNAHQLWRISKSVRLKYRLVRAALITAGTSGVLLAGAAILIR